MRLGLFVSVVLTALALPAAAGSDNERSARFEMAAGWSVSTFQDRATQKLSHCMAAKTYHATTVEQRQQIQALSLTVMIKVGADGSMQFILLGDGWSIAPSIHLVEFTFPDGLNFSINATRSSEMSLSAAFQSQPIWYASLMGSHQVAISINHEQIGLFDLSGAREALAQTLVCSTSRSLRPSHESVSTVLRGTL